MLTTIFSLIGAVAIGLMIVKLLIWVATRMADSIVDADERRYQANRRAQEVAAALALHARRK